MNEPRIIDTWTPDPRLELELVSLASIYRRAIERSEQAKKGGSATAPDDAKGGSTNDSSAKVKSSP